MHEAPLVARPSWRAGGYSVVPLWHPSQSRARSGDEAARRSARAGKVRQQLAMVWVLLDLSAQARTRALRRTIGMRAASTPGVCSCRIGAARGTQMSTTSCHSDGGVVCASSDGTRRAASVLDAAIKLTGRKTRSSALGLYLTEMDGANALTWRARRRSHNAQLSGRCPGQRSDAAAQASAGRHSLRCRGSEPSGRTSLALLTRQRLRQRLRQRSNS